MATRASAWDANQRPASSSNSSVAKKLSHIAVSYAPPTLPIDGRTPLFGSALKAAPGASEVVRPIGYVALRLSVDQRGYLEDAAV